MVAARYAPGPPTPLEPNTSGPAPSVAASGAAAATTKNTIPAVPTALRFSAFWGVDSFITSLLSQKGNAGDSPATVTHCHCENASALASPPKRLPLPDAPRPPNG